MHERFIAGSGPPGAGPSGIPTPHEIYDKPGGPVSTRAGDARKFHRQFRPAGRRALRNTAPP